MLITSVWNVNKVDAVLSVIVGESLREQYIYVFSDSSYRVFDHNLVAFGDWKEIESDWESVVAPVDAALHWESEGKTFIVSGSYITKHSKRSVFQKSRSKILA